MAGVIRTLLSGIVLATIAAACGSPGDSAALPTPRIEVIENLSAFQLGEAETDLLFDDLSVFIRTSPGEVEQAALMQVDAEDPLARTAALYALANTASGKDAQRALSHALKDNDMTNRTLAAAGLLTMGDKQGIPVLIEALRSDEMLKYSEPPRQAWQYAIELLLQYVDVDLGLLQAEDRTAASSAADAWEQWWEASNADLSWNTGVERFQ
jgi:hypothetical protein